MTARRLRKVVRIVLGILYLMRKNGIRKDVYKMIPAPRSLDNIMKDVKIDPETKKVTFSEGTTDEQKKEFFGWMEEVNKGIFRSFEIKKRE